MTAWWRRIVGKPDALPPEFWQPFLLSSLAALGEKSRSSFVGMTWRRNTTAGAILQWQSRLEDVNREVIKFGVAVPGGMEHVGLWARTLHETGNRHTIDDCSNVFSTVKRAAVSNTQVANQLRVSAHALSSHVSRHKTSGSVFSDKLRGNQDDRLVQWCPAEGPHRVGNILLGVETGSRAIHRGIRARRSGIVCVHGWHLCRS